jgi:hypothetical protein
MIMKEAILANPELVKMLADTLRELALEALGVVLLALAGATPLIVRWFRDRGWHITAEQEAQLLRLAPLAAQGVEEYARNAAKHGLTMVPNEKLEQAVRIARDMARDGLRSYSDAKIKAAIEAYLPEMRAKLGQTPDLPVFRVRGPVGS